MLQRTRTIEDGLQAEARAAERSGDFAFQHFCTPHLSRHRSPDHEVLVERARFHLRNAQSRRVPTSVGELQAYVFDPDSGRPEGTVLFVHGWTGEAAFMTAFAEPFRKRGFRAVLFDFPAHGRSEGERTSLISCAHAVREVAEALGPIDFAVAHSLGGHAALLAGGGGPPMPRGYPFRGYVLVAVPNKFSQVTEQFSRDLGLSPEARSVYEGHLERIAQRRIVDFTAANLLRETGKAAFLLHSRDDADVAFSDAEEIVAACPAAGLQAYDGLGHRKILYAPPVVRTAVTYLLRQRALVGASREQA